MNLKVTMLRKASHTKKEYIHCYLVYINDMNCKQFTVTESRAVVTCGPACCDK